jgi:WD40 repeat protein
MLFSQLKKENSMKKIILFFIVNTYFFTSNGMDAPGSFFKPVAAWISKKLAPETKLTLTTMCWIKTTDKKTIECDEKAIHESALLTLMKSRGLGATKESAIKFPISDNDYALFTSAIKSPETIALSALASLLTIANTFKSPNLYALLMQKILPHDVDNRIARLIFSPKTLKNIIIKNHSELYCKSFALYNNPTIATQFSHRGNYFLTHITSTSPSDNRIINSCLWETATQKIIKKFYDYDIVQLNPQSNCIALGTTHNRSNKCAMLSLYDIDNNRTIALYGKQALSSLTFSPDGNYIAATFLPTNGQSIIHLWNISDYNNIIHSELIGHKEKIEAIAFNNQSTQLISGSNDINSSVLLWDITNHNNITHQTLLTNLHHHFTHFVFNADDTIILGKTRSKHSFLFSLKTKNHPQCIPISRQSNLLLNSPENCNFSYDITIAFALNGTPYQSSTDGKFITSSWSQDQVLSTWQILPHKKIMGKSFYHNHISPITSLDCNNNGLLLSCSADHMSLWNKNGTLLTKINPHPDKPLSALLSFNGMYILATEKGPCTSSSSHKKIITHTETTHVTLYKLFDESTEAVLSQMNKSLLTKEAVMLRALCSCAQRSDPLPNKPFLIKHNSLASNVFAQLETQQQKLLQQQFSIKHTD